jgi:hypothetical protein
MQSSWELAGDWALADVTALAKCQKLIVAVAWHTYQTSSRQHMQNIPLLAMIGEAAVHNPRPSL